MKAISKILESRIGKFHVRALCIIALCISNFIMSFGIAGYYNLGKSPAMMIIGCALTLALVAVLSVPNLEADPDDDSE